MAEEGSERRIFTRALFPCKILISSPVRMLTSHTENVSEGGIRVILEEKVPVFTMVGIELFVDKNKPMKCKGKVAWIKEIINPIERQATMYDVGIKFVDLSDFDKVYIKKLVDACVPKDTDKK